MNTQDDKRMLGPVEDAPWDEKFADEQMNSIGPVEGARWARYDPGMRWIGTGEMFRNEDGCTWCSVILEVPDDMPDGDIAAVLRKLAARIDRR